MRDKATTERAINAVRYKMDLLVLDCPKNIVHDENKDQPQELFLDILFHCWQARRVR